MKTLVEDKELKRLRAMAEGVGGYEPSALWERLAALDPKEIRWLPARGRLTLRFQQTAATVRGSFSPARQKTHPASPAR